MTNQFTVIFERDEDWSIAYCPEIPGANGQGKTRDEARQSLQQAVGLILDDRREDGPNHEQELCIRQDPHLI